MWNKNVESYAWLYIPDAEINAPIQQSALDDSFYLKHDQDGNCSPVCCAFTQLANAQDFSDPVTVIYGHNVDGIFAALHYFEDAEFFKENATFNVYTPGHILTYEVVLACECDGRHILNSFGFDRASVREEYFASVLNIKILTFLLALMGSMRCLRKRIVMRRSTSGLCMKSMSEIPRSPVSNLSASPCL